VAKEVLKNASVLINSVNLSDHASSVTLEDTAAEVDFTSFGPSGYTEIGQGMKDATITVDFFNDHAAGSVADTVQALYSSGGTFPIRVKPDLQGTVAYTMTARVFSNPMLAGAVGDANTISVAFRHGGTLGIVRGSLAAGTP
jgi:hypothetical protein